MERRSSTLTIEELRHQFVDIEFPEYQREPDVWTREQKQRLIDSILRRFDIASIYLYERDDSGLECIDGRQRLNAIMSFLGENELDSQDNRFPLKLYNEISAGLPSPYHTLDGRTYSELIRGQDADSRGAVQALHQYHITVIYLSGVAEPDEFNLQFLRLNLGTLINAGEKLHAMVGRMRDLLFEEGGIGRHPFFGGLRIPTRRYSKEQTAAQVLLQAFSKRATGGFSRARHFDLQRFLKAHADLPDDDATVAEIRQSLDFLETSLGEAREFLRNRAMTVSVVLLAWTEAAYEHSDWAGTFRAFIEAFLGRLRWQVNNMKEFTVDQRYLDLVEFQRHLTQASVERPAVTQRHEFLTREWAKWREDGALTGDWEYEQATGKRPPVL